MSPEDQIDRAVDHLYEKYGDSGYMKLWIPWSDNGPRLAFFRMLLADPEATRQEVVRIWNELDGGPEG